MDLERTLGATNSAAAPRVDERELSPGDGVGRYLLLGKLGAGAMGIVYSAFDPELDRKVALKLLLPGGERGPHDVGRARMLREAQALARLSHPNVVAVHDVGTHGDRVWIAMEFVAGRTVTDWARQRPRPWSEILEVLIAAGHGVAAAHAVGLVHRDLKPDNLMLGDDGRVRVMDFGLAHARPDAATSATPIVHAPLVTDSVATTLASDAIEPRASTSAALVQQLTRTGALQGTPAYMAPEQWRGQDAAAAADQFGWCVMAWELLHGEPPFAGDSVASLATAVLAGELRPPPRGRRVPGWLRRVLERGLAVEPQRRWPTMAALLAALERGRTRSRVRTASLILLGVAALAAVIAGHRRWDAAQQVAACEQAGADIQRAWNDAARARVRDAFTATAVSYAAIAADRAIPWLDEQAAAWQRARTDACLATDVRAAWTADLAERADACLEDHRLEFESLVAEFTRARPLVVQRSVVAAASLRAPADCLDEAALARQPTPPPALRQALRDARAELARATSLGSAGAYADALAAVTAARDRAVDWPPLWAAARTREAFLLERMGTYDQAEAAATAAYFAAADAGAWDVAADAATRLTSAVGHRLARHADGRVWARHAAVAISHAGDPGNLREAARLTVLALVHENAGEYAEAQALGERALEIAEQTHGPDHPAVAASLNNLALIHERRGTYAAAQALQERALAIRERTLGPDHPDVALSLNNLALVLEITRSPREAQAMYERALAIWQAALGPDHPLVASCLNNLALTHMAQGDLAKARTMHERALAIRERTLGPDHPDVAASLTNLAMIDQETGANAEARALYERALAIWERTGSTDHPAVATSLNNLAILHSLTGDHAAARPLFERALAIREKALGPDHLDVAWTLVNLASLHMATGDPATARTLHARALKIRESALGTDHPDVADSLAHLADLHLAAGTLTEARTLHTRALALREAARGPDHSEVAHSLAGLARVALATRQPRDALPLLARAVRILDAHPGVQPGELRARFDLAATLVATGGDVARARAEATRARDGLRTPGAGTPAELAEVEAWLRRHRANH